MKNNDSFALQDFLPYLLSMASEQSSLSFQSVYKSRYGILRNEWRVLFHLGMYGEMRAMDIGRRALIHKTKISRAVSRLEKRRFIKCVEVENDRRQVLLSLTKQGEIVYRDLYETARAYNKEISSGFTDEENKILQKCLRSLAGFPV